MPRPGPRLIARVQREAPRVQLHFMQKPHKDSAPFSPPPFTVFAAQEVPSGAARTVAIACALGALVVVVLDAAMVNVALPAIARSLRVAPEASVRVVTAYQLAVVVALLPCAALGERFGYRRVFTIGIALFVCASVACACAPSLSFLVVSRFIQGLGGAAVMALCVALLRFVVSERQLGAALGWNTLAVAVASAAGPTVGALVVSTASFRRLFAIDLALGVMALLATRALSLVDGNGSRAASTLIPFDLFSVWLPC
jgi:DHA2 family multidrug resistance protein-like MFS transporter